MRTLAIVDEAPESQYLYPEFLMFQALFRRHGIDAVICAPDELAFRDGGKTLAVLTYGGEVTLLRAKTGRVVRRIPPPTGHTLWNGTVNEDWSLFAAVTVGGVFVWPGVHTAPAAAPDPRCPPRG